MCPKIVENKSTKGQQLFYLKQRSQIKKVSFLFKDLCEFEGSVDPIFSDYLDLLKFTNTQKLSMFSIKCSKSSVTMIDNYQELWVWGDGTLGQIGYGRQTKFMNVPFGLGKFLGKGYQDVSAGFTHTVAIDSKSKLYIWGENKFCSHGSLQGQTKFKPVKVVKTVFGNILNDKIYAQLIAAGEDFTLALVNNQLISFGKEDQGRLGLDQAKIDYTDHPYQIQIPKGQIKISGICVGLNHCLYWDVLGAIYSWGSNENGKAGHPIVKQSQSLIILSPYRIAALSDAHIIYASAGYNNSCAITSKGQLYQWGVIVHNDLGNSQADITRPQQVSAYEYLSNNKLENIRFLKVSSFGYHNAAIDSSGILYTWGKNHHGCLGHDDQKKEYSQPTIVRDLAMLHTVAVGVGEYFTVVSTMSSKSNEIYFKNMIDFQERLTSNLKDRVARSKLIKFKQMSNQQKDHQPQSANILQTLSPSSEQVIKKMKHQLTINELRTTQRRYLEDVVKTNEKLLRDSNKQKETQIAIEAFASQKDEIQGIKQFYKSSKDQHKQDTLPVSYMSQKTHSMEQLPEIKIVYDIITEKISNEKNTYFEQDYVSDDIEEVKADIHQEHFESFINSEMKTKTQRKNLILQGFKGVPIQSNFQDEINLIHREYQKNNHNKPFNLMDERRKSFREKDSDKQFIQTQKDLQIKNKGREAKVQQILVPTTQSQSQQNRVRSAKQIITKIETLFLTHQKEREDTLQYSELELDSIRTKQVRQVDPDKLLTKRKEELQMMGRILNFKIVSAQRKKNQLIEGRQARVYQNYVRKTVDYHKYVEEKQSRDVQTKQNLLNWFIYLNLENFIQCVNYIKQQQLELKREQFFRNRRIKIIQRQFRQISVKKKLNQMSNKQRYHLRLMVFKFVLNKRIKRRQNAARTLKKHFILKDIKRKLRLNLTILINNILHIQNFIHWTKKQSQQRLLKVSQVFDGQILNVFTQQTQFDKISKIQDMQKKVDSSSQESMQRTLYILTQKLDQTKQLQSQEIQNRYQKFEDFLTQKKNSNKININRILLEFTTEISFVQKATTTLDKKIDEIQTTSALAMYIDMAKLIPIERGQAVQTQVYQPLQPTSVDRQASKRFSMVSSPLGQNLVRRSESQLKFEEEFSLLCFTQHSDCIQLPSNFSIRIDQLKSSPSLFEIAIYLEQQVKQEIIQLMVIECRQKYQVLLQKFIEKKKSFIRENTELIDLQRAKLLLRTPLFKIQQLHKKENLQNQMRRNNKDKYQQTNISQPFKSDCQIKDHLPFGELKSIIADGLPNAPQRPIFKISITNELFKKYFNIYYVTMKKKLTDLETKTKFGKKK